MPSKSKIELEYIVNTPQRILFNRLSTISGLKTWFADEVKINARTYTFVWDKTEHNAEMLEQMPNKLIQFKWIDDSYKDSYFEFRIAKEELTGDVALYVTDFVDTADLAETKQLWDTQIARLKHSLGVLTN